MWFAFAVFLLALFLACAIMSLCWVVYYFTKNAGVVDIGYACTFLAIGLLYACLLSGKFSRTILLGSMIALWAGRLALSLLFRFRVSHEDPRYTELIHSWGKERDKNVYFLFLVQGAIATFLSLVFLLAFRNPAPHLLFWEGIGLCIWAVGFVGESLADHQLREFKRDPEKEGKVCEEGLWYYSRHPNYFFEWVLWMGFAFFATPAPLGWIGWLSPLVVLFLLLYVSGIPPTEKQALQTKGEAYRHYQETTSSFIPWRKFHT